MSCDCFHNISLVNTATHRSTQKNFESFYIFMKMPISQQPIEQNNFFFFVNKAENVYFCMNIIIFPIFHFFPPKMVTEVQKHDNFSWFWQILTKNIFLNSFFDQLPMYLSKFCFVILIKQVKSFLLHILKIQIAKGKGSKMGKECKKCLPTTSARPFKWQFKTCSDSIFEYTRHGDDSPCNYLSRKKKI